MTELGFLLDLLLNHKLPLKTRQAVTERVKHVEEGLTPKQVFYPRGEPTPPPLPKQLAIQSPSTLTAMMRHAEQGVPNAQPPILACADQQPMISAVPPPPPQPVAVVAQTAATQAAMAAREAAIAGQISGKPDKGQTRPRKF